MLGPMSSRSRIPAAILGALGAGALALLVLAAPAHAASAQAQMQEQADRAALTGVNMLGTSSADDATRRQEALDATRQALDAIPGVAKEVSASVKDLTMTVKLSSKTINIVSVARYVAPDQPADWAWTSPRNFAGNRKPVLLGSNCGPDCSANRMR